MTEPNLILVREPSTPPTRDVKNTLDTEGLRAARDALWAEAVHLYRGGEPWHLGAAHEAGMRVEHESRLEQDPWEELLAAWASPRTDEKGALPYSMNEILDAALGLRATTQKPRVTARVSSVLAKLGYRKRKRGSEPRTDFYERRPDPGGLPACRPTSTERLFSEADPSKGERS
jgi:predicted P-loop ATPase